MVFRTPAFWWQKSPTFLSQLLRPVTSVYDLIASSRLGGFRYRSRLPVLCVGNFVAGGAGKTPVVGALYPLLLESGLKPVILSKGYGGLSKQPLLVDPKFHGFELVGDEPLLLAQLGMRIVVSSDRVKGAEYIERHLEADIILLDDGMQSPDLYKDFNLSVVDGAVGIGNGQCLPAGPLRANIMAQLDHTNTILLIGNDKTGVLEIPGLKNKEIFSCQISSPEEICQTLNGRRVVAFAGIGRPEKFFDTLRNFGANVLDARAFPDHHRYNNKDLRFLLEQASLHDAELWTTQKDRVRLPPKFKCFVLPVTCHLPSDLLPVILRSLPIGYNT
jgi:tetraacyldisaccharide 4'-kinase